MLLFLLFIMQEAVAGLFPIVKQEPLEFVWCVEAHPQSHKRELLSRHLKW
jgi:hypothetical protein